MTSKRANAVNRAIAEACGYTFEYIDYSMSRQVVRSPQGELVRIPDYYTDMNAAIAAAGELLNYGLHIYLDPDNPHIVYKNGKRDEFGDLWTTLPAQSNAPADIAAAICEAIVTARQMVVESEVTSE